MFPSGISSKVVLVDMQEHVHRKVMEVDFFAPWILTHDCIKGIILQLRSKDQT